MGEIRLAVNLKDQIEYFKSDPESVYNTWFIENETRMKAFRSIRRGIINVIDSIKKEPLEMILKVHH
jgi:type II restriction enzyme